MIKIENVEIGGLEAAFRGMRNPKNSWDKSDSCFKDFNNDGYIGDNDLKLAKTLAKAGTDHGKFLRMITVWCDITAPLYWIAEHDTYKVGTVRNSCSFMHKGVSKPFEINDFSVQDERIYDVFNEVTLNGVTPEIVGQVDTYILDEVAMWEHIIKTLNTLRGMYLETKNEDIFQVIRQILPQGYNVRYTWQANYAVLRNIYHARKNHRLIEWKEFCKWIENLPYADTLITEEE